MLYSFRGGKEYERSFWGDLGIPRTWLKQKKGKHTTLNSLMFFFLLKDLSCFFWSFLTDTSMWWREPSIWWLGFAIVQGFVLPSMARQTLQTWHWASLIVDFLLHQKKSCPASFECHQKSIITKDTHHDYDILSLGHDDYDLHLDWKMWFLSIHFKTEKRVLHGFAALWESSNLCHCHPWGEGSLLHVPTISTHKNQGKKFFRQYILVLLAFKTFSVTKTVVKLRLCKQVDLISTWWCSENEVFALHDFLQMFFKCYCTRKNMSFFWLCAWRCLCFFSFSNAIWIKFSEAFNWYMPFRHRGGLKEVCVNWSLGKS